METQTPVVFPTRKRSGTGPGRTEHPLEVLPPPGDAIASECRRSVLTVMGYVSGVWKLDLDELVAEFVRDRHGKLTLVRVSSFEWRDGQLVHGRNSIFHQ